MFTGIDVSSNNPHPIDWAKVKQAGHSFAFVKITEGTTYVNPFAAGDIAAARAAGLLVGAYLFLHPDQPIGTQIALAAQHLNGCKLLVIDSELTSGSTEGVCRSHVVHEVATTWPNIALATHAALNAARAIKGVSEAMLYANPNFLDNMAGSPWGYPLWLADYGPARAPRLCELWQYTSTATVPGVGGQTDVSSFNGTSAQLAVLFGARPSPPPAPKPTPKPTPKPAPSKGPDVKLFQTVSIKTSLTGNGVADVTLPWAKRGPVALQASDGMKSSGNAYATNANGNVRIVVTGCPRLKLVQVDVYEAV